MRPLNPAGADFLSAGIHAGTVLFGAVSRAVPDPVIWLSYILGCTIRSHLFGAVPDPVVWLRYTLGCTIRPHSACRLRGVLRRLRIPQAASQPHPASYLESAEACKFD